MIYSLVVEGFIFAQTDVFGKYLPSRSSIEAVMTRLENINRTDDENRSNKRTFCMLNYKTVVELDKSVNPLRYLTELENNNIFQNYQEWLAIIEAGRKPTSLELSVMYQRNLDRMCQLTGHDFYCVMQDNFVIAWYGYLLGNSGHIGIQEIRKELTSFLLVVGGWKDSKDHKPNEKQDDYLSKLRGYDDLRFADERFSEFTNTVSNLVDSNHEMYVLNIAQHEVELRLIQIAEESPNSLAPFLCPFCNAILDVERGNRPKAKCEKCGNKYSASTSAKHRQTPSAINKKVNRLSLPKANGGENMFCSWCGDPRVCYILEQENLCKKCLDERGLWRML